MRTCGNSASVRGPIVPERSSKWFVLAAGDGLLSMPLCGQIQDRFAALHQAAGRPANMAVFKRHDLEGSLHCEVMVYFSPAAGSLARAFGARPCARPAQAGLQLLAGEPDCWSVLFA